MIKQLQTLQANLGKSGMAQHSLMNDEGLKDYGLLLISEPSCFRHESNSVVAPPTIHHRWAQFLPSGRAVEGRFPIRSLIYVNRALQAQAVSIPSSDLTGVRIQVQGRSILVISVYVPPGDQDALVRTCGLIQDTIRRHGEGNEVIMGGDFNRHDQLWGGDGVGASARQGEASPIIELMVNLDLQSLLPRGTITYESGPRQSTIDLVLATPGLTANRTVCQPHQTEHGSDHLAISTTFALQMDTLATPSCPRLFKNADWKRIRAMVADKVGQAPRTITDDEIDSHATRLTSAVEAAIRLHVPQAKPSPYAKRWWTQDLTQLRNDYTHWRNRARAARRPGFTDHQIERRSKEAKHTFHDTARRQKKDHWRQFLSEPTNIWKAARFMHSDVSPNGQVISSLSTPSGQVVGRANEIASALKDAFFKEVPVGDSYKLDGTAPDFQPFAHQPLTPEEVRRAVLGAQPHKAPGEDGIPAIAWRELWPIVGRYIFRLFEASLRASYVPQAWKIAEIVPLRKPDKADYTSAKAYRPISLLPTLSKALEAVVAERLSYLAEEHSLLPKNHFGARKRRSHGTSPQPDPREDIRRLAGRDGPELGQLRRERGIQWSQSERATTTAKSSSDTRGASQVDRGVLHSSSSVDSREWGRLQGI